MEIWQKMWVGVFFWTQCSSVRLGWIAGRILVNFDGSGLGFTECSHIGSGFKKCHRRRWAIWPTTSAITDGHNSNTTLLASNIKLVTARQSAAASFDFVNKMDPERLPCPMVPTGWVRGSVTDHACLPVGRLRYWLSRQLAYVRRD